MKKPSADADGFDFDEFKIQQQVLQQQQNQPLQP
jgi:hypothetical protein